MLVIDGRSATAAPVASVRILRIVSGELSFGCMRAVDLRGVPATVMVHRDGQCPYACAIPSRDAHVLCEHSHASVYRAHAEIDLGHMWLRRRLPLDLCRGYFPVCRPLCSPSPPRSPVACPPA